MKRSGIIIAPSILSADFSDLKNEVASVEKAGARWLHIDVMDGHFVPNISIGPAVVRALRKNSKLFFDVHLMIKDPEAYWREFADAGSNLITFHAEAVSNKLKLIKAIKRAGLKAGISIKPKTGLGTIKKLMPYLDLLLIMTVEPGFAGQKFMAQMMSKVREARKLIEKLKSRCLLEVDGGINTETAETAVAAGADVLVAGNSVFSSDDPGKAFKKLQQAR